MKICQICGKKPAVRKYCPDCRIIANRIACRENNRKHSNAAIKYCQSCGVKLNFEGNRKFRFCPECRAKRREKISTQTKNAFRLISNIYGDFRDVERWVKRQLAGVDLSKYLPKQKEY